MNHKGIEFAILARPGRDQWTLVICYPSRAPVESQIEGSRDKVIAAARARIDRELLRTPNRKTTPH
jgi:hypothetical protein